MLLPEASSAGRETWWSQSYTLVLDLKKITGYVAKPETPGIHLMVKQFVFMMVCLPKFIEL